jgi:hypothetical protein
MSPTRTRALELTLGAWVRARLPHLAAEMVMFVLKQGWACLFGMLLLTAILISRAFWQSDWPIARYDALFLFAIAVQVAFLTLRLETPAVPYHRHGDGNLQNTRRIMGLPGAGDFQTCWRSAFFRLYVCLCRLLYGASDPYL